MQGGAWDHCRVRLLSKVNARTLFKLLRPIAILVASAKLWSRCFFVALEAYDTVLNQAHMGFKKTYGCAELVLLIRLPLSKRAEWGLQALLAQEDFARIRLHPPLRYPSGYVEEEGARAPCDGVRPRSSMGQCDLRI